MTKLQSYKSNLDGFIHRLSNSPEVVRDRIPLDGRDDSARFASSLASYRAKSQTVRWLGSHSSNTSAESGKRVERGEK